MLALFGAMHQFLIDTDIPQNGLTNNYGSVQLSIIPHDSRAQGGMEASTVMAVLKGIMYYMSEEGFTQKSIQITDATRGWIGDAVLGTHQQIDGS